MTRAISFLTATAKRYPPSLLTFRSAISSDAAALDAALANAKATLADTASTKLDDAEDELTEILVEIGAMKAEDTSDNIFVTISPWLFGIFGPNGFSEMPKLLINKLIKPVYETINSILGMIR